MSSQTIFQSPHSVVLPVKGLVGSMAQSAVESASTAFANFDARRSQFKQRPQAVAAQTANISVSLPTWQQPLQGSQSSFNKSGALVLVILAHVLAFYVFSRSPPQIKHAVTEPMQVVIMAEHQSTQDVLQPLLPLPLPVHLNLPIEPVVIDIVDPESTSITVETRQTEPTATTVATTIAAPKVVSSVEYIREPAVKYPPAARALKQRGTVTLRALIDIDGHAREVNVHHSSGYRVLDDAARTAVLNALFKPYVENSRALPVYVFIPIEFGAAASG